MSATVSAIAADINEHHRLAIESATSAIEHARQCGALLTEAKRDTGHGGWLAWLSENCPQITTRTAQRYMRLAQEWPAITRHAEANATAPSHLGIHAAL